MQEQTEVSNTSSIHAGTQIGQVALTVSDLRRSLRFYQDVLGFAVIDHADGSAGLGVEASPPLLLLSEQPGAQPMPRRATGLYHFAILVPGRADLGRSLRRLLETRYPLDGASDHLVSEALYLADPDGNGIEIYRDRPRGDWPRIDGRIRMASDPLDLDAILAEAEREARPWAGLPAGTRIGHIHLQVADLGEAKDFYHGGLGFDLMAAMPGALFLSAGGYHHHLGLNTWQSRGASPPPAGTAGLRFFTISLPDEAEQARVIARLVSAGVPFEREAGAVTLHDPWRNRIVLATGA